MALPGTYDFARDAWFKGIGAVGKALGPVTVSDPGGRAGSTASRDALRAHIAARLPAQSAGVADRVRHRRPECGRPGRCRRDAPQRPHPFAVGQRTAHRRGRRLRDVPQPQAARAQRAAGAAFQPRAGVGRRRGRGGHRLHFADRSAGADGAKLRCRTAGPRRDRARPRRHQHAPDRHRRAGRARCSGRRRSPAPASR